MSENNYHEPWSFTGRPGSSDEHLVNTQNKSLFWMWKNFYFADRREIERMRICVNFCAGIPTEALEQVSHVPLTLVDLLRSAIEFHKLDGHDPRLFIPLVLIAMVKGNADDK